MAALTIKNIPEHIYGRLKTRARRNHRSINGEILSILEQATSLPPFDVQTTLERARKVRELTANSRVTREKPGQGPVGHPLDRCTPAFRHILDGG